MSLFDISTTPVLAEVWMDSDLLFRVRRRWLWRWSLRLFKRWVDAGFRKGARNRKLRLLFQWMRRHSLSVEHAVLGDMLRTLLRHESLRIRVVCFGHGGRVEEESLTAYLLEHIPEKTRRIVVVPYDSTEAFVQSMQRHRSVYLFTRKSLPELHTLYTTKTASSMEDLVMDPLRD